MIRVGVDVGPLQGPITGVGRAVDGMVRQLRQQTSVELSEYVVSFRAKLRKNTQRLPFPAGLSIKSWGQRDFPPVGPFFKGIQLLHGMNYVVPPTKLPRVVTVYDCWALLNPAQCSSITNDAMKALRRAIQNGAVVHASSHATATTLRELFPTTRIEMIYLGTPERRLTSSLKTRPDALSDMGDAPFIVAIGTVEKRKNYPRLVEAFALAAHEHSDLQLVIAGSAGDDSNLLKQAVDSLSPKLAKRVHLIGRATDDNIAWLYQQAIAMAYPSLDEGFGFPLLEAMSAKLPIIGSTRGSIPEVSGAAAILVDPLDVSALAEALVNVVTNSELRINLQSAGTTQSQSFSWEKTAQQLINLYSDLVK